MMHDENKWYFVEVLVQSVWIRVQPLVDIGRGDRAEPERRRRTRRGSGIWLDRKYCD